MSATHTYLDAFKTAKRVVIKIGSALLIDSADGLLRETWLKALAEDVAALRARGTQVLIVSSGSIALGRTLLKLGSKDLTLAQKQACAAAGQARLTQVYEGILAPHGITTAQALLTLMDTEMRRRWLNARSTLETLLELGAVPIINENDTVTTREIRYGDNDRLAGRVAQMVGADVLVLLSDIDGLYTADPRNDASAKHISVIEDITPDIEAMGGQANAQSGVGSGGMATKIVAAKIATQAGCHMAIVEGEVMRPLKALETGAKASWFKAVSDPKAARKQWILGSLQPSGSITIDDGAHTALIAGKSLLPAGVIAVTGEFEKGESVTICAQGGTILAHGLIAYGSVDAQKIIGLKSGDIKTVLGYSAGDSLVHRDDLVMTQDGLQR